MCIQVKANGVLNILKFQSNLWAVYIPQSKTKLLNKKSALKKNVNIIYELMITFVWSYDAILETFC